MKKHIVHVVSAAAICAGLVATSVPAADAAPAGCVSQREFAQVKKGFTKAKVARVFGTNGKREAFSTGGGYTFEIRSYKTCTPYGSVAVGFSNGKLDNKSGVF